MKSKLELKHLGIRVEVFHIAAFFQGVTYDKKKQNKSFPSKLSIRPLFIVFHKQAFAVSLIGALFLLPENLT